MSDKKFIRFRKRVMMLFKKHYRYWIILQKKDHGNVKDFDQ